MKSQRILVILSILLSACGLLIPAIYNGFPLVYSDTGAYIASGFQGTVPGDRPISYGLFLRHSSLATSLWFTVLTQALLLSVFVYRLFCKIWSEPKTRWWAFLLGMMVLIVSSSASYFASMLLADISCSLSLFLLFFLLFDSPKNKWFFALLLVGYLFLSSMHLANVYGHLVVVFGVGILKLLRRDFLMTLAWRKWVIGSAIVLLNFLFLPTLHSYYGGGFVATKNGHLFISARNIESGAMKMVLDDKCGSEEFALCAYKDSLPNNGSDFLWLPESVLYKIGGWNEHADEYKKLNGYVFSEPKYLMQFLKHYYRVASFHFFEHKIGEELIPLGLQSPPGWEIESNFKEELPRFLNAKQAQDFYGGKFEGINIWISWVLIFSLIVILAELLFGQSNFYLVAFTWLSIFMYVGNFFAVCVASSGSRYNSRLDWLLVLVAILTLFSRIGRLKRFAI